MNLHGIVAPIISVVNPMTSVVIKHSTGYTEDDTGRQIPAYTSEPAMAQVQALSFKDITQTQGLTMNGARRAIYLYGQSDGAQRPSAQGGDLIEFPTGPGVPAHLAGTVWLVVQQTESWPDWCKVVVTRQNEQAA